ncbi:alpha/beta fold hydrolase [Nonomuraea angiospora]|uniref:thioesterase II family protein n=1 Tax=Nonomuraea angiospora TaxID=46172 RepID=UPI00340D211E
MLGMPIVCIPYAGSGSSVYRSWAALSNFSLDVLAVPLPGREELIDEEPRQDVGSVLEAVLPQVLDWLDGRTETAVFGHSMGGVVAYELAHRLVDAAVSVSLLVTSGSHAPWDTPPNPIATLPDDEFLANIHRFAGYRPPALDDPEFRELMLPVLRADAAIRERYRPSSSRPLSARILAVRGDDDSVVSAADNARWAAATTFPLLQAELPGGHMYLREDPRPLLRLIVGQLVGV